MTSDNHPNHKPAHTAIGCVLLAVTVALGVGACTALTNDSDDTSASAPAPEATVEPADVDTEPALTDEEVTDLALDLTWEQMSPVEQDELCAEVRLLGAGRSATELVGAAGPDSDLHEATVRDWLIDVCL